MGERVGVGVGLDCLGVAGALEFEMVTLAVRRLRDAMSALTDGATNRVGVSAQVLAEVHEATLGLMLLTGTRDLSAAVAAAAAGTN
jgi:hypothetical protein